MRILVVRLQIKPEFRDPFVAIAKLNADGANSNEPGCRRFDVLEEEEHPNTFVFYEVYDDDEAFQAHQASPHYTQYAATFRPEWLAAPTTVSRCVNVFPSDCEWK
ncbi:MAG: putative quinol monooxygenase [Anaerolineales bacterium]